MNKYIITANEIDMGIYQAESEAHALDLFAQDAGYTGYADVAAQFGYNAIATVTRTAEDAYTEAHAEALALLEAIREQIEDMPAPSEQTHWGNVADMQCIVESLKPITLWEEGS